eukprot:1881926-Rhodomonas_salina.1
MQSPVLPHSMVRSSYAHPHHPTRRFRIVLSLPYEMRGTEHMVLPGRASGDRDGAGGKAGGTITSYAPQCAVLT